MCSTIDMIFRIECPLFRLSTMWSRSILLASTADSEQENSQHVATLWVVLLLLLQTINTVRTCATRLTNLALDPIVVSMETHTHWTWRLLSYTQPEPKPEPKHAYPTVQKRSVAVCIIVALLHTFPCLYSNAHVEHGSFLLAHQQQKEMILMFTTCTYSFTSPIAQLKRENKEKNNNIKNIIIEIENIK